MCFIIPLMKPEKNLQRKRHLQPLLWTHVSLSSVSCDCCWEYFLFILLNVWRMDGQALCLRGVFRQRGLGHYVCVFTSSCTQREREVKVDCRPVLPLSIAPLILSFLLQVVFCGYTKAQISSSLLFLSFLSFCFPFTLFFFLSSFILSKENNFQFVSFHYWFVCSVPSLWHCLFCLFLPLLPFFCSFFSAQLSFLYQFHSSSLQFPVRIFFLLLPLSLTAFLFVYFLLVCFLPLSPIISLPFLPLFSSILVSSLFFLFLSFQSPFL